MKIEFLATLAAVAEHGSLAAAAEQVHLTPSAVSLQMRQLETWFGQPLLDRSGRQVRVTGFAREVARIGGRALEDLEAMRSKAGAQPSGKVRIGIAVSALTSLLPDAFAQLQRQAPGVKLELQRGASDQLLNDVKAGRIDAGVIVRPPSGGSRRLDWTPLVSEEFVLVVPRDLSGSDPRRLLRQLPWLRLDRSLLTGRIAARYVDGLLPHHPALLDLPASDVIVAMIESGEGVSVLPELRPRLRELYQVREVRLGRGAPVRQMVLVRRSADIDQRALDAVVRAFEWAARRVTANSG